MDSTFQPYNSLNAGGYTPRFVYAREQRVIFYMLIFTCNFLRVKFYRYKILGILDGQF